MKWKYVQVNEPKKIHDRSGSISAGIHRLNSFQQFFKTLRSRNLLDAM